MLRLLTDEGLHGSVVRGLRQYQNDMNVVRAQDVGLRTVEDQVVLEWAATNGRIVLTADRDTMIGLAYDRIANGLPMPGLFVLRPGVTVGQAIDAVLLVARCSTHEEWNNRVEFLPL